MKFTAIVPTRGRPEMLNGCLHSFAYLESRVNEVHYVACVDLDDPVTAEAAKLYQRRYPTLTILFFNRPPSLGQYVNEAAAKFPADVYLSLADDVICASPGWDEAIRKAVEEDPRGVFWWRTPETRKATYAIVTRAWHEAAGRIFTDLFPFWFDDMWLREVYLMASGKDIPMLDGARLNDIPLKTTRMRDLIFWDDFFHLVRYRRRIEARRIAEKFGWPDVTGALNFTPNHAFRARADKVAEVQGEKAPPDARYLQAKARAETILAKLGAAQLAIAAA